ncbi:MAG TPA: hypothetical protein VLG74_01575, partial [Blastocatellia bacterium]|nr:hypothetical protein [Blastocatellia bacterium]
SITYKPESIPDHCYGGPVSLRLLVLFAMLGIVSVAIELVVLVSYGWAAERGSRLILKPRFALLTDRIAGGFPVCAGLGLAATRRL